MNKTKSIIGVVVIVVAVIILIIWRGSNKDSSPAEVIQNPLGQVSTASSTLPVSETTKVSSSVSQYLNAELGLSVKYPTIWEKEETSSGVRFIMPIDASQVSTVAKLQADATVVVTKCAFPPVTTVNERSTVTVGTMSFNMISMSNTVQGRSYFDRMYSYQSGSVCYTFTYSYIALSPDSKGLSGSNKTQAENNNKAIRDTADAAFTAMVKSFALVAPAAGREETSASPIKK